MVKLDIFLPNFLMQEVQIMMKKKFLRNKRNIRKETRKEIKEYFLKGKSSIQKMIVPHPMKIMIVIVTQEKYSSWH
jgi:hypothetical protein